MRDYEPSLPGIAFWAFLLGIACGIMLGCSSTERVTIPPAESTVNLDGDTTYMQGPVPVAGRGEETLPEETQVFDELLSGLPLQVDQFVVDRRSEDEHVSLTTRRGEDTYRDQWPMPAYGERLIIRPVLDTSYAQGEPRGGVRDTVRDTVLASSPGQGPGLPELFPRRTDGLEVHPHAEIDGSPEEEVVDARVPDDGYFDNPWDFFAWFGIVGIVGGTLYLLRGFIPKIGIGI